MVQDIVHQAVTPFCSVRLADQKFGTGDALRGAPLDDDRMKLTPAVSHRSCDDDLFGCPEREVYGSQHPQGANRTCYR